MEATCLGTGANSFVEAGLKGRPHYPWGSQVPESGEVGVASCLSGTLPWWAASVPLCACGTFLPFITGVGVGVGVTLFAHCPRNYEDIFWREK